MKILESTRETLSKFGIDSAQAIQKYPFNVKNVMCLFWFFMMNISGYLFLINEAQTLKEYVSILSGSITLAIMFIEFSLHVWKMKQLFEFIVNFENLIQKSEYKFIFSAIHL